MTPHFLVDADAWEFKKGTTGKVEDFDSTVFLLVLRCLLLLLDLVTVTVVLV